MDDPVSSALGTMLCCICQSDPGLDVLVQNHVLPIFYTANLDTLISRCLRVSIAEKSHHDQGSAYKRSDECEQLTEQWRDSRKMPFQLAKVVEQKIF